MRTNLLSLLFCGLAALSLSACDEEPVVEQAAPAATVEAAEDAPACCNIPTEASGPAADVVAEASGEACLPEACETACEITDCEITDCETDEDCKEIPECDEKSRCTPEKSPE